MRKKILALVLARKGSSRLKNKNMLKLKDKPLIQWTFEKLYKKNIRKLLDSLNLGDLKIDGNLLNILTPLIRSKGLELHPDYAIRRRNASKEVTQKKEEEWKRLRELIELLKNQKTELLLIPLL